MQERKYSYKAAVSLYLTGIKYKSGVDYKKLRQIIEKPPRKYSKDTL